MSPSNNKPKCKLIGEDGNVFNLIGIVNRTLKADGQPDNAKEFTEKAFQCHSYDEVLSLITDYAEVI